MANVELRRGESNDIVIFASAVRTAATNNSDDFINLAGYKGIVLSLMITAENGTHTLDVKLQMQSPLGNYTDIAGAAFAQQSAVTAAAIMLTVYPGIAETTNVSVSDILPSKFRVVAVGAGATSMTWSLTGSLLK